MVDNTNKTTAPAPNSPNATTGGDELGKNVVSDSQQKAASTSATTKTASHTSPAKTTTQDNVASKTPTGKVTGEDEASQVDTSPSGGVKEPQIGSVKEAINLQGTEKYEPYPEEEAKEPTAQEKQKALNEQPVESLEQLRDFQIRNQVPGALRGEQREKVKKLQEDIAKEGAKHTRLSSQEQTRLADSKRK